MNLPDPHYESYRVNTNTNSLRSEENNSLDTLLNHIALLSVSYISAIDNLRTYDICEECSEGMFHDSEGHKVSRGGLLAASLVV